MPEINVVVDLPQVALPDAPPVTLKIGVPVIDLPHFEAMDFEPEVAAPKVVPAKRQPEGPALNLKNIKLPQQSPKPVAPQEVLEVKSWSEQIVEGLPTVPQITNVTLASMVGVTAGVATPFLLKLVKPVVKKAAKKLQKALGRQPIPEGVSARRASQRSLRG